jgi:hypothetical protein
MNNLYRKVAVASVCIVLSFALEPNKEVKAGPPQHVFDFTSTRSFIVVDTNQDGLGDYAYNPIPVLAVGQRFEEEYRSFYEFNIAQLLTSPRGIDYASLSVNADSFGTRLNSGSRYGPSFQLEVYSYDYPGENIGTPFSVFESGEYLSSTRKFSEITPYYLSFNVLPFIKEKVKNKSAFVGFGIRDTYNYKTSSDDEKGILYLKKEARLTTIAPPEPVPEPTTIFGSAIGIYLGGWLKRKKSTLQNKAKSQA